MQNQAQNIGSRDHMEVARAAQWLWQQAGRPAGRYIEFWTKVEQALADARTAEQNLAELARDLSRVEGAVRATHEAQAAVPVEEARHPETSGLNESAPILAPKTIHHSEWVEAKFEHPVLSKTPNHDRTADLTAGSAVGARPINGSAARARPSIHKETSLP
jgi:hypothetical protein